MVTWKSKYQLNRPIQAQINHPIPTSFLDQALEPLSYISAPTRPSQSCELPAVRLLSKQSLDSEQAIAVTCSNDDCGEKANPAPAPWIESPLCRCSQSPRGSLGLCKNAYFFWLGVDVQGEIAVHNRMRLIGKRADLGGLWGGKGDFQGWKQIPSPKSAYIPSFPAQIGLLSNFLASGKDYKFEFELV